VFPVFGRQEVASCKADFAPTIHGDKEQKQRERERHTHIVIYIYMCNIERVDNQGLRLDVDFRHLFRLPVLKSAESHHCIKVEVKGGQPNSTHLNT